MWFTQKYFGAIVVNPLKNSLFIGKDEPLFRTGKTELNRKEFFQCTPRLNLSRFRNPFLISYNFLHKEFFTVS